MPSCSPFRPVVQTLRAYPLPVQLFAFWLGVLGTIAAAHPSVARSVLAVGFPGDVAGALVGVALATPPGGRLELLAVGVAPSVARNWSGSWPHKGPPSVFKRL
jgi:hypothetical protein